LLRLRLYEHGEGVNNKECQTVSARWEGIRKRGRPQKTWIDEVKKM
jgi:hypothetical protein